jgi:hypothetical protein
MKNILVSDWKKDKTETQEIWLFVIRWLLKTESSLCPVPAFSPYKIKRKTLSGLPSARTSMQSEPQGKSCPLDLSIYFELIFRH